MLNYKTIPQKCFSNTCQLLLLLTVKIAVRPTNFYLGIEIARVSRQLLVTVRCKRLLTDEVSEVGLVGEIDNELDEVDNYELDEVSEVRKGDVR